MLSFREMLIEGLFGGDKCKSIAQKIAKLRKSIEGPRGGVKSDKEKMKSEKVHEKINALIAKKKSMGCD